MNPSRIDANPDRLLVEWPDGLAREIPARLLREACPCAGCVSEITGRRTLDASRLPPKMTITAAEPMGHYAVSLAFSDGHGTGIYSYDLLRTLAGQTA